MPPEGCRLVEPAEDLAEDYLAYAQEFRAAGEPFVDDELHQANGDAASLIKLWREQAAGRRLPEGYVPCSRYWLVRDRRILATGRLRHRLTEALEDEGGHIGYDVRPRERRKGYATCLLAMMLDKARQLGLHRVLLTCNVDNPASRRTIEKNGGRLASQGVSKRTGKPVLRFWIDLREARGAWNRR